MQQFGIGEIARRAGVAASTIRYYERIGLLPPSARVNTKRRYDARILDKLNVIRLAQELGFSLNEIQALVNDFPEDTPPAARWKAFAGRKIRELDDLIQQAQTRKEFLEHTRDCRCDTLETCANGVSVGGGRDTG